MKLTAVFVLLFSIQLSARVLAQKVTLNVKNGVLSQVLEELQRQTACDFSYNEQILRKSKVVNLNLKNVTLEKALDKLFIDQPFKYELVDGIIVVKIIQKETKLNNKNVDFVLPVDSKQHQSIRGRVVDENGKPLVGASVQIIGTSNVTQTNQNGNFILETDRQSAVVKIQFVGYTTKTIHINNTEEVNVILVQTKEDLDEVVVLGYGTSTRRTMTDAVSSVDSLIFQENAASSVVEIIQGQVPGMMTMMGTGAPGEEPMVIMRGMSSLEGNLGPLIVIDDIPMDESFSFNDINPNDILSIDILKGASASSIYGSRGAGGVFMITTKNGFNSPPTIGYRFNYGKVTLNEPLEMLNADEFKTLFAESLWNRVRDMNMIGNNALIGDIAAYSTIYRTTIEQGFWGEEDTDWLGLLYQPAVNANHNLNITGRGEQLGYTIGLGYTDEVGQVIGSGYKRYNLDFKLDSKQSKLFQYGMILSGSSQDRDESPVSLADALTMRPDMPARNEDGSIFVPATATGYRNPLIALEGTDRNSLSLTYRMAGYIQVTPQKSVPGLTWKTLVSQNNSLSNRSIYYASNTAIGSNNWSTTLPRQGRRIEGLSKTGKFEFDTRLSYRRTFKRRHNVDGVAAFNYIQNSSFSENRTIDNFPEDNALNGPFHGTTPLQSTGTAWRASMLSYVFRANYNYNREYMLTVSMRRDGTSRMAPNARYANFPSVAGAWNIGENKWFKKQVPWVDMFKLRGAWGRTANAAVPAYGWMTTFTSSSYNNNTGIVPQQVANDQLAWETSTQYDLGIDFSLFKRGLLEGSINYYNKFTKGALNSYSLPLSSGLISTSTMANLIDIENRGIELDLTIHPVRNRTIHWSISGNIGQNRNELKRMDADLKRLSAHAATILKVGEPIGLFYGYRTDGLFSSWEEVAYYHSLNEYNYYQAFHMAPGEIILKDNNGNGWVEFGTGTASYNEVERQILGKSFPDFFGGVSTRVRYKGFTFSAQGSYSVGASKNWSVMENQFQFSSSNPKNLLKLNLNRWTPDRPDAPYPKMLMNPENDTRQFGRAKPLTSYFHDYWIYDASYFKINNVRLSYDPPTSLLERYVPVLSRAQIGMSVNNLFLFTKYPGVNPEAYDRVDRIAGPAMDNSMYPKTRTYNFSLNFTFK
ncbi:SusC/RagA family TonB-linked outer membrane protein [Sphingobacterium faecale]|uniref:SusC/RagA family TonB-linked outer membrane protein n=1 Tax=Sphingobacterium faecale TaxID=2803775 RepID=A0ABS1R9N5_9SPHI|nr:SusC/RagA family TonB-linked outer membrane protein [Sphingobacterium faecale]MBL1411440.1 SusC/RagA family TonB-linked outer membrane protein [Sphingobacterium faecale]